MVGEEGLGGFIPNPDLEGPWGEEGPEVSEEAAMDADGV
jgi:hypothetical protein